jgi:hypothetical protein
MAETDSVIRYRLELCKWMFNIDQAGFIITRCAAIPSASAPLDGLDGYGV